MAQVERKNVCRNIGPNNGSE